MAHRRVGSAFDPRTVTENIVDTPLNEEMSKSFLEYAYSVIYARALPDARDGLKPVQRRIVYQMGAMNLTPDRPYMKSARVVGEVMGKLHPHGDSAIYEAMVRLAQPFAMRLPLVDGHGNFGSLDDGPAASRYTEARLAPSSLGMNADIDEDTVDFRPNYDNKLQEPEVLPSALPNLLVNGASGIAVGMATNMISHNLIEVVRAAQHILRHPEATLDDIMRFIPGPDLPGGGIILGREGIRDAYASGQGSFLTRAKVHIENVSSRKKGLVFTELPYMIGPEKVLERIAEGVKNKKLDGISSAIDLSDRHNGLKLVVEIKTGFDPEKVLAALYKYTPLENSFTINNVALVHGRPHRLGLRQLLDVWIEHRQHVIEHRTAYRLRKAQERLHLVAGLLIAMLDIDTVIQLIRNADSAEDAKQALIQRFTLDEVQANYILELRLRRLTKMSRLELEAERDDLEEKIAELEAILASQDRLNAVVNDEMEAVIAQYGTPRRTLLLEDDGTPVTLDPASQYQPSGDNQQDNNAQSNTSRGTANNRLQTTSTQYAGLPLQSNAEDTLSLAALTSTQSQASLEIEDAPCVVALSATGLLVRTDVTVADYFAHRTLQTPRLQYDIVQSYIETSTRDTIGLVTSAGRLIKVSVVELPYVPMENNAYSFAHGLSAQEFLHSTEHTAAISNERVVDVINLNNTTPIALGTRHGVVKRWNVEDAPTTMDSWSIISLKDNDEVLRAMPAHDNDRLVFITQESSLLTFDAAQVRPQGRTSAGMIGIKLSESVQVLSFASIPHDLLSWNSEESKGAVVLTVAGSTDALEGTENGAAKITPLALYPTKGRGTGGVRSMRFLKGQDTLIMAFVGAYPLFANAYHQTPIDLPDIVEKRDGSGQELPAVIDSIGN